MTTRPSPWCAIGEVTLVSQRDITIGDVLQISTGDKLPADARLIESNDLTADESALTGESVPSAKAADAVFADPKTPVADRTNMLYSGCFVTAGNGRAVVTAMGDDTKFGKIARELRAADTGMTPLQEKLAKLGKVIAVVGSIVAALVFMLQVARFVASGTASFDTISEAFITSIMLIVATVPEGLPTIVAACLAVNIIKMSKQNALVKKMVACETIGCINVICSDKTGTLTQNRMTVIEVYNAPGRTLEKPEQIRNRMLLENFCVNGTAEQQSTILFTLFVVFQLFNAFNSRELGNASLFANLLRNKVMIGVFALMFALQVLVVQFGGAMFRTVPLPIDMWLKIIAVGFGVVMLQEVIKAVKRAAAAIRARRTANESDSQQPHQPIALDLVD